MTEAEIIEKLQNGSEQAFKELVDKYQKLVVNTCFGMLHDRDDAEDVAQDVFIEVFRSVQSFRADSKISTWLYRIAVNRSLNFIRDNKKRKRFQSFDDAVKSKNAIFEKFTSGDSDDADFNLENNQRANMLHEAINSLPENQKVAFSLNKYEDLSYKEISEVMDLSVSSVESLIHRAKKNLQKKLYTCYKKKCI
ncbi:sigma-70 family RNA polymerase sigma factor [Maribellus comscasis]|uniref:RNA polymerase sigma factor n=1 Tax=Maribellus comscasis TaxID=2681766 RepID=A0A6I6JZ21_9BACT|nr:sigma-70 family RNA polymerase sigma factor [Maribellus comscasis]QGY44393.1 sigma-70 family RNA polymerase sigma factor [Maribellus comscasis]